MYVLAQIYDTDDERQLLASYVFRVKTDAKDVDDPLLRTKLIVRAGERAAADANALSGETFYTPTHFNVELTQVNDPEEI